MLKNGDKIAHTQDAVVLEKMISQFLYNKASESEPIKSESTNLDSGALTDVMEDLVH